MRRRGDRVTITTGKYAGQTGTVESNVYQKSVDYHNDLSNGIQVMLDTGLIIVRWDQVAAILTSKNDNISGNENPTSYNGVCGVDSHFVYDGRSS